MDDQGLEIFLMRGIPQRMTETEVVSSLYQMGVPLPAFWYVPSIRNSHQENRGYAFIGFERGGWELPYLHTLVRNDPALGLELERSTACSAQMVNNAELWTRIQHFSKKDVWRARTLSGYMLEAMRQQGLPTIPPASLPQQAAAQAVWNPMEHQPELLFPPSLQSPQQTAAAAQSHPLVPLQTGPQQQALRPESRATSSTSQHGQGWPPTMPLPVFERVLPSEDQDSRSDNRTVETLQATPGSSGGSSSSSHGIQGCIMGSNGATSQDSDSSQPKGSQVQSGDSQQDTSAGSGKHQDNGGLRPPSEIPWTNLCTLPKQPAIAVVEDKAAGSDAFPQLYTGSFSVDV